MIIRVSKNRLLQAASIALLPPAIYNFVVWFGHPDTMWETAYMRSFTGGVTCLIMSIIFLFISCRSADRTIVLWNKG